MNGSEQRAGIRQVPLEKLLGGISALELAGNREPAGEITCVTSDSREVIPGALFVAVRGYCTDGHRFIKSAVERGAGSVICEEIPSGIEDGVLFIKVTDARIALAEAARIYYGEASDQLMIIGVTGTNGKTTTSKLITSMLNARGISCGYIGTNLCTYAEREIPLDRTTPEAHGLHALFRQMLDGGCRAVVMEVSSHALMLKRVHGIRFRAAVFTNLTPEHLDFHETMEAYASAKQLLFDQLTPDGFAVLNRDDPAAPFMAERVRPEKIYCCSLSSRQPSSLACGNSFFAEITSASIASSRVALHFPETVVSMEVRLPGSFNVMNMLEAASVGFGMGLDPDEICRSLSLVSAVEGRMERVGESCSGGMAFVDYAHTPDALFKALSTLRALKDEHSRLVVVFGCGGNRDRSKRPEMGRIASELADEVIITSDNPRDEDPEAILDAIEQGMNRSGRYRRIIDRAEAIRVAVSMIRTGDVLLVAGKGHEKYQEISGRKAFFSDREQLLTSMQHSCEGEPEKECER
ncbi:UDP-N-acetylmuramoyl-L-alanyl-D-glutamate--2,6-diaminopimelate ligase [Chlorobium sp. BLA1]|uniref:UDP-N-acetylmuramoyl-L-alanyl-D-glutamate--2, 6-diaminopimelate ligase n=1 Tax=Candidatus Chlorobium masyuteum TaxID=2716876 RepID=UPI0014229A78|nr:UDP-N-acetylmuramoyl-L-alanyl-D-glutamate--2,6-diaminopimelate ligase [Candidatus Chlorobium masyuteum]NHQ59636.1 UDP-N-acetylmuramoyl-L-alanyl-D-glutamate--2,6-diaminopimelate ligase [Candidatus Chlorobium masyuteum]